MSGFKHFYYEKSCRDIKFLFNWKNSPWFSEDFHAFSDLRSTQSDSQGFWPFGIFKGHPRPQRMVFSSTPKINLPNSDFLKIAIGTSNNPINTHRSRNTCEKVKKSFFSVFFTFRPLRFMGSPDCNFMKIAMGGFYFRSWKKPLLGFFGGRGWPLKRPKGQNP